MSKTFINQYYTHLDRALQHGKSRNEQSIRNYFWMLLNEYARKQHYEVVPEVTTMGTKGAKVRPDGILKNLFGLDIGLWESKDEKTNLDDEIDAKIKKGYPLNNILFEDSATAVLYQRGEEALRVNMRDADKLHEILTAFISFKSETVHRFEDALEKFKADIPTIVQTLRKRIDEAGTKNKNFIAVSETFLELCKAEINPEITDADVREMMIQHVLTSDIFNKIFDEPEFHRHNNIARELEKLVETLFNHSARKNLLGQIEHYYDAINSAAAGIADHHEKQKFLKVLYENVYKVYNPKAADRLGVVYTPHEIVQFMIESADYLLHKHFGKTLADRDVEILDPATGTGTFIASIIDYIPNQHLAYKYKNEIHANEVAILPYYVANLNVEFTFKQKMGYYEEFQNLCFVDTLDNTGALAYSGKQHSLFGLSSENAERIKRQNSRKISVIIGNPPYNANQANENENNKNREYPAIDMRIKDTYIKNSTAQKTKVYDMYARFYRWATDRMEKNGILAFITNRSFIDSRTFDGFRKVVASEFNAIYIIDLGGDVRANPKLSGTKNNVFGIQTGVAIMILVRHEKNFIEAQTKKELNELKKEYGIVSEPVVLYNQKEFFSTQGCRIYYVRRPEMDTKEEKLEFLRTNKIESIAFERITPDKNNNWINLPENNWDDLISFEKLFSLTTPGAVSNRDDWAYDFSRKTIEDKFKYECKEINKLIHLKDESFPDTIKWSNTLKGRFLKRAKASFKNEAIIQSLFRPYSLKYYYADKYWNDRLTQNHYDIFGKELNKENICLSFNGVGMDKSFHVLATKYLPHLQLTPNGQCVSLYLYNKSGNRIENITDWGHEQFVAHYKDKKSSAEQSRSIKKEDIFHYTYAVLHNPAYRKKYELNLKREFPRLPFYKDFWKWAKWGRQLMDLHINYETAKPYALKSVTLSEVEGSKRKPAQKQIFTQAKEPEVLLGKKAKVKLKADKGLGTIKLDEETTVTGIPQMAWDYNLGNRSALEWILDQYKEKTPSDPTLAEKFNTYRFADYKEHVIDLLRRVCTVSVETMKIVNKMENTGG